MLIDEQKNGENLFFEMVDDCEQDVRDDTADKRNEKKKRNNKKQSGGKNKSAGNENSGNEYDRVLSQVGRPLACTINLDDNFIRSGKYEHLSVNDIKKTVSYMMDERAISYKTLTHALVSKKQRFGLACDSDGNCELYELRRDHKARTKRVANTRPAKRIMDPMFAFVAGDNVYVIFNIPTRAAIDSGVKGRKPNIFGDGTVLASGTPFVVQFDTGSGNVSFLSPRMSPMTRYVCALVDEPDGDLPMLLIANVLTAKSEQKEKAPSIKQLIKMFLDDEDAPKRAKGEFEHGISVLRIEENAKYSLIPMSGDKRYFIDSVVIEKSDDGDNNIITIHSKTNDDDDSEDIEELMEDMEENIKKEQESDYADSMRETLQMDGGHGNIDAANGASSDDVRETPLEDDESCAVDTTATEPFEQDAE